MTYLKFNSVKGIVHPEMDISSFTHPKDIPNLYEFLSVEECFNCLCQYNESQCGPKQHWTPSTYCMDKYIKKLFINEWLRHFHRRKNILQQTDVWEPMEWGFLRELQGVDEKLIIN